jgi:hypothetical protein
VGVADVASARSVGIPSWLSSTSKLQSVGGEKGCPVRKSVWARRSKLRSTAVITTLGGLPLQRLTEPAVLKDIAADQSATKVEERQVDVARRS